MLLLLKGMSHKMDLALKTCMVSFRTRPFLYFLSAQMIF